MGGETIGGEGGGFEMSAKGFHLKMGLSMAQFRAHPLATHSLAFSVRLGSLPNTSLIRCSRAGTLELLPTISTDEICSFVSPALSSACRYAKSPAYGHDFEQEGWLLNTVLRLQRKP